MKFKDFQAPVLFSSTFKALNLGEKNSSTFKYFEGCVATLTDRPTHRHLSVIVWFYISLDSSFWTWSSQPITWPVQKNLVFPTNRLFYRHTWLSTVGDRAFPVAGSRLWDSLPPDVTSASKLISFPDHFLPNSFQFVVLYTVYSSGLAVLYLSHSK